MAKKESKPSRAFNALGATVNRVVKATTGIEPGKNAKALKTGEKADVLRKQLREARQADVAARKGVSQQLDIYRNVKNMGKKAYQSKMAAGYAREGSKVSPSDFDYDDGKEKQKEFLKNAVRRKYATSETRAQARKAADSFMGVK